MLFKIVHPAKFLAGERRAQMSISWTDQELREKMDGAHARWELRLLFDDPAAAARHGLSNLRDEEVRRALADRDRGRRGPTEVTEPGRPVW